MTMLKRTLAGSLIEIEGIFEIVSVVALQRRSRRVNTISGPTASHGAVRYRRLCRVVQEGVARGGVDAFQHALARADGLPRGIGQQRPVATING